MTINDITTYLESIAPTALQDSYDNAGLLVGNCKNKISGVLITLDITEQVVAEAVELGFNLIIAHHPIIFTGIKKLTGKTYIERSVIMAIKHDIAIYAAHTNLDNVINNGVSSKIAQKIGLTNLKILAPVKNQLKKIVVFVPNAYADTLRHAMFNAGAGNIGNYSNCSFNNNGNGTFTASPNAQPFAGQINQPHTEPETRIEVIVPAHLTNNVIQAIKTTHPYQEPAYDIYPLDNYWQQTGAGMVGELQKPIDEKVFLQNVKNIFNCQIIKHTQLLGKPIKTVAFCGGSGSSLLTNAIAANAQIFLTADVKYHQFFDTNQKIILADIGHFESEQYTKELFYELLMNKFSTFAIRLTNVNTNPIKYL